MRARVEKVDVLGWNMSGSEHQRGALSQGIEEKKYTTESGMKDLDKIK